MLGVFTVVAAFFVPPDTRDCGKGITCFPCLPKDEPMPATFNCSLPRVSACIHEPHHKLPSTSASSADACCKQCAENAHCQAWTFWDATKCNIFSTPSPTIVAGACTSGAPNAPPSPAPAPAPGAACSDCPNIVLMFTDDQDLLIGGYDPSGKSKTMAQTQATIADAGLTMTHWAIHTPICAPSRAELMSGRYYHNVKNEQRSPPSGLCGSGAVGHVDLEHKVWPNVFAQTLRVKKGYTTGLFGKCMNGECHNPPAMNGAFDRWFEGTNFQGGKWWDNESPGNEFENASYAGGYGTSVIGNKTIEWISDVTSKPAAERRPFFVFFAPHAPHSPATPSAWYKDACVGVASPRIPNFNWSTPLFHNLVSRQPPLTKADAAGIDQLARKRCQTLLSVDDSYVEIHAAVAALGLEKKTYFLVTSDHGYNLGHHRLPSNKFLLYDHSMRIPMLFKGPGIRAGAESDFLGTQVDLAPTILGMAGIAAPPGMDGKSLVPLLTSGGDAGALLGATRAHIASLAAPTIAREASFLEYYNQGPWEVGTEHALDDWSNTCVRVVWCIESKCLSSPLSPHLLSPLHAVPGTLASTCAPRRGGIGSTASSIRTGSRATSRRSTSTSSSISTRIRTSSST